MFLKQDNTIRVLVPKPPYAMFSKGVPCCRGSNSPGKVTQDPPLPNAITMTYWTRKNSPYSSPPHFELTDDFTISHTYTRNKNTNQSLETLKAPLPGSFGCQAITLTPASCCP